MAAVAPSPLPRWDLSAAFPSLESPELAQAVEKLKLDIEEFGKAIGRAEMLNPEGANADTVNLEELIKQYNGLTSRMRTLGAFVHGFVAVDSRNELALAKDSELDLLSVPFSQHSTRFTSWIGKLPLEEVLAKSAIAKDHEFALRKSQIAAQHLMSPAEEALAAELSPTAFGGWSKLHGQVTSQIDVTLDLHGEKQNMPMSKVRTLAYDPDRNIRKAAFEAELKTWNANETALAAALNGVKGTITVLAKRRNWESPLDEAIFGANIDRETLNAMMLAAKEAFPDFRRYLNAKAKLLGIKKLAFFDLFAPVEGADMEWSYDEGAAFVSKNFRKFSARLADYADRAFNENWIDVEPRAGKRDGAFCMWLVGDQSRVLMNYKPSFSSVKTLAHELGHAYHNLCLTDRTMMQRRTPMTLAETASIFCETVIENAALAEANSAQKLLILEGGLQGACQVTVDIASRFLFEQEVFKGRVKRELSAGEFCSLMEDAQKQTYGDGLDPEYLHPYMWAVKPHYYSRSFYNFPYMYGMLFGLGLYAQYRQDPEAFKAKYDDLLSSTGMADASTLAHRFGFDVRTPDFWRSSFDVIRERITTFEKSIG